MVHSSDALLALRRGLQDGARAPPRPHAPAAAGLRPGVQGGSGGRARAEGLEARQGRARAEGPVRSPAPAEGEALARTETLPPGHGNAARRPLEWGRDQLGRLTR